MKWILLLLVIIIEIVLKKGLMLGLILLTVWLKGISIKKNSDEWNKYFLSLNEYFLNRYVTILYAISTVLSSYVAYVLFNVFEFQSPLFKTIILAIVCIIISVIRYRRKGKKKIKEGLNKIRKSILEEEAKNI